MKKLFYDLETKSTVPITSGVYAYAEKAEILLISWAVNDSEVRIWDVKNTTMPEALYLAIQDSDEHIAHNVAFDRTILAHADLGLPNFPLHKVRCTATQALCHSLPASLGQLSELYKLGDASKDKSGKALIRLFCIPNKIGGFNQSADYPVEWTAFKEYAAQDIVAMRELHRRMPTVNYPDNEFELKLHQRDLCINERGFQADTELCRAVVAAAKKEQAKLAEQALEMTCGTCTTTQPAKLRAYIQEIYDVIMPDLTKGAVAALLKLEISPGLRLLLVNRQKASSTSVAKYGRILEWLSSDGRLRGTLKFCGASRTGREASQGPQLQNMPRPTVPFGKVERYIEYFKSGAIDVIEDDPLAAASDCIRSVFTAKPGSKLVIADLAAIEGRVSAWGAEEGWLVQAFEDFDAGTGQDLYRVTYARTFGVDVITVTKEQRQIGKVLMLALQFSAGVGGLAAFATAYGMDLELLADTVKLPSEIREQAQAWYDFALKNGKPMPEVSERVFIALDGLKRLWRAAHPATVQRWAELQNDAVATLYGVDTGIFSMDRSWLRMQLPSGRYLCYAQAKVDTHGAVSYMSTNAVTRKWERTPTFGGRWAENWTQATARDVFMANFERVERAGYLIVMHVHDELVTEVPNMSFYTADQLVSLMAWPVSWAQGLPLAAAGFESFRYRKE